MIMNTEKMDKVGSKLDVKNSDIKMNSQKFKSSKNLTYLANIQNTDYRYHLI